MPVRRALCLALALILAGQTAGADAFRDARYIEPTERYPHGVLGDTVEHGALEVTRSDGVRLAARLDPSLVFEDTAPRLVDLDGDGAPEVITVEAHQRHGARLSVWGSGESALERLAVTPFIGTRFRWLGVVGAADLDGDGAVEIAYVDRPHLARILRVWRYDAQGARPRLIEIATAQGHTNHRIGERDIAGGVRNCDGPAEMLTASPDWSRMLATRIEAGRLSTRVIGRETSRRAFRAALACP
ncbi:MAG: VCBS repeat-containing protein [Pseudomonadota bacterium]